MRLVSKIVNTKEIVWVYWKQTLYHKVGVRLCTSHPPHDYIWVRCSKANCLTESGLIILDMIVVLINIFSFILSIVLVWLYERCLYWRISWICCFKKVDKCFDWLLTRNCISLAFKSLPEIWEALLVNTNLGKPCLIVKWVWSPQVFRNLNLVDVCKGLLVYPN